MHTFIYASAILDRFIVVVQKTSNNKTNRVCVYVCMHACMVQLNNNCIYTDHDCRFKVHSVQGAFGQLTYELIINGVTQEDYGTYTCKIKNSQGQTTKEVKLIGK